MSCCEGTLQTTACLLILIIYDLPLKKNNNNYIWSQVILILFLFFLSHHLIFSFTCIVHPDIKLSRIPVQSLEQGLFKVPLSLKTKYIYISPSRWSYITTCIIHGTADLHRKPNSLCCSYFHLTLKLFNRLCENPSTVRNWNRRIEIDH